MPTLARIAKMFRAIFIFLALTTSGFLGVAETMSAQTVTAEVLDAGIYSGTVVKILNDPNSPTGKVKVGELVLRSSTSEIPAILNTKFGVRFLLRSTSQETHCVLRVTYTFPPMRNPETGKTSNSYSALLTVPYNDRNTGIFWDLAHEWELVPGKWTMRLEQGDKTLLEKVFTVTKAR